MRKVVRRAACPSCAEVVRCGFIARECLWFVEAKRWVGPDSRRPSIEASDVTRTVPCALPS